MKQVLFSLLTATLLGSAAQAASCIKAGYTQADFLALNSAYEAQHAQLIADRDQAIANTTGQTAEEKNEQVYAILIKYNADRQAVDAAYKEKFNSMTIPCR